MFNESESILIQYPASKTGSIFNVPMGVTVIGPTVFQYATALASVTIPSTVTSIGLSSFLDTPSLLSITVDEVNSYYKDISGVLFNESGSTLIQYPANKSGSAYIVLAGVTIIGPDAFKNTTLLTSINIPSSVTSIGPTTFTDSGILTVRIPYENGLDIVPPDTSVSFYGITVTTSIANELIIAALFNGYGELFETTELLNGATMAVIKGYTSIGSYVFQNVPYLTSISIPSSITSIGVDAFATSGLTTVSIPAINGLNITSPSTDTYFFGRTVNIIEPSQYDEPMVIRLDMLNELSNINTSAIFGQSVDLTNSTDGILFYKISVDDIQSIFKFSIDNLLNNVSNAVSDVATPYASNSKLFKNGSAHALYGISSIVYSQSYDDAAPSDNAFNVVKDYLTASGRPYGKTAETFVKNIAQNMFGSKLALSMILNVPAIVNDYKLSIENCIKSVNDKFASQNAAVFEATQKIYSVMAYNKSSRFGMNYKAELTDSNIVDGTYFCTAEPPSQVATTAAVVVLIEDGVVKNISVTSPSEVYSIGNTVLFRDSTTGDLIARIVSINPVQTAILNGSLGVATPIPFEPTDKLILKFTVNSNPAQINVTASVTVGVVVDIV